MTLKHYDIKEAVRLLKAGYVLISALKDDDSSFVIAKKKIFVHSAKGGIYLDTYSFQDIYKDQIFLIDEESNNEEAVDPKKDEEYYSWRQ